MTYELIYILNPKLTEEEAEKKSAELKSMVEGKVETIVRDDFWGKKKLAYPIKNHADGYYVLIEFKADTQKVEEIDKDLRPRENVIRFLVTRIDEKMEAARKAAMKRQEERKEEAEKKEKSATTKKEEEKEKKVEDEKIAKEIKDKDKSDLKDLDKKIEEILDEDIA